MPGRTILIVDTDPATARRVRGVVAGKPWEVLETRAAADALENLREWAPAMVFAALNLPGSNGYDLARRLREHAPELRVFLIHGGFDFVDVERARASGVERCIKKPLQADLLRELLRVEPPEPPPPPPRVPLDVELEDLPTANLQPLEEAGLLHAWVPTSHEEREATFIPIPPQAIGPASSSLDPQIEKAVISVLPEVLEIVLRKSLRQPGPLRDLVVLTVKRALIEDPGLRALLELPGSRGGTRS
jgi:CheY-like chemotaxis protein